MPGLLLELLHMLNSFHTYNTPEIGTPIPASREIRKLWPRGKIIYHMSQRCKGLNKDLKPELSSLKSVLSLV